MGKELMHTMDVDVSGNVRKVMKIRPGPEKIGDSYKMRISSDPMVGDLKPNISADGNHLSYTLTHEGASYIAVHFDSMDLPKGCVMRISNGITDDPGYIMNGKGKMNMGRFWAQHVRGDAMVIQVKCKKETKTKPIFEIDEYAAGYSGAIGTASICGPDDKENAICYVQSHPTEYDKARAIARLLISGSSACTGFLASDSSVLITNEHCIESESDAINTDYQFMAEFSQCNIPAGTMCDVVGTVISGATLLTNSVEYDYALVQLSDDPALTYGFLELDDRVAVVGEQIYIPQHPGFACKQFGIEDTSTTDGLCRVSGFLDACTGFAYNDVGYLCDTAGGSSGSPVLATTNHKVIALHHCGGCPNLAVPINEFFAEIAPFLIENATFPPTAAPTPFECDENIFVLDLLTDDFGSETTWAVTDESIDVVASGGPYPDNTLVQEKRCFEDGCYVFTIFDSFGDGICCSFGEGSYNVTYNGQEIVSGGGDFGFSESTRFGEDCSPSFPPTPEPTFTPTFPPPTPAPTNFECDDSDDKVFVLDLLTDDYGFETTWDVVDLITGVLVGNGGPYANNMRFVERLCLEDGCYNFTIFDLEGDGICCDFGMGSYSVTFDGELVASGGEFDFEESTVFGELCFSPLPSSAPTPSAKTDPPSPSPMTDPPTPSPMTDPPTSPPMDSKDEKSPDVKSGARDKKKDKSGGNNRNKRKKQNNKKSGGNKENISKKGNHKK